MTINGGENMRRPIVIANWKMNTTLPEAVILAKRIKQLAEKFDDLEIVLMPPVIWLPTLFEDLHIKPRSLAFGVQNFYPEKEGAFTGEISLAMVKKFVNFALVGHSERRTILGESDEFVGEKVSAGLEAGLQVVLCVGELTKVMLKSRTRGRPTLIEKQSDVLRQLDEALANVRDRDLEHLLVVYEPLWAIGTGENVSGAHAAAVIKEIRGWAEHRFGRTAVARIRALYGGSVDGRIIDEYAAQPDIDGVLVGGASLKFDQFEQIVEAMAGRTRKEWE